MTNSTSITSRLVLCSSERRAPALSSARVARSQSSARRLKKIAEARSPSTTEPSRVGACSSAWGAAWGAARAHCVRTACALRMHYMRTACVHCVCTAYALRIYTACSSVGSSAAAAARKAQPLT